jgi:hypothetical protein
MPDFPAKRKIFGGGKIFLFACGLGLRLGHPPEPRAAFLAGGVGGADEL